MNQCITVNHGKIRKMRNTSQIKDWSLHHKHFFKVNTVWDLRYLKNWFNQEKIVFPLYRPCGKIHKTWLEKEDISYIIEADLSDIG